MFGSLVKNSRNIKGFDFETIEKLVTPAIKKSDYSQKEFLTLLQKADEIYYPNKKRKKKKK
jgi:hypothetical protein